MTGSFAVKADIAALASQDAAEADACGFTPKVEITEDLQAVFRNWRSSCGEGPRTASGTWIADRPSP
ncbi:DUF6778 family protein [Rhodobacter sp. 24-YEA-8]|uniref:DUF6778 family protein n=1 Tax=Rhodobacter sp. 24-YEA-8 TaxID=1884310 RepID=UPI000B851E40